jgi:hypothetical protein
MIQQGKENSRMKIVITCKSGACLYFTHFPIKQYKPSTNKPSHSSSSLNAGRIGIDKEFDICDICLSF